MGFALVSDIHGNLEALETVLADIARKGVERTFCLGDVVGYGPDPAACVDRIQEVCEACVLGNHDEALIWGATGFNPLARTAIEWTRRKLRPWGPFAVIAQRRWRFIEGLPPRIDRPEGLLVHGSPRDPTSEYILERDLYYGDPDRFRELFGFFETLCFVGHSHVPGIFTDSFQYLAARGDGATFRHETGKWIVNVGSVGQPRDRDPRACYVEVDGERIIYHRLAYDIHAVQEKIFASRGLDPRLAERLAEGI
ncbi:MAG: metallophosphoesterase family protein [Planctomycetes bacterium]|nr:metallophosphoesterase family protein [Planctomycetota bacterium]